MKVFLPLLVFLSLSLRGQHGGIAFTERPFAELLEQARAEDKLIFIDAYASWCGPCKMMVAKVFPDAKVGAVYNERFINAKFDMESGEGPGLARRYKVDAYPTYLFVNGEGELVHKGLGYIPKPALLELAEVAVSDRSMGALRQRYEGGERGADFIGQYARMLSESRDGERANGVVQEYLGTQSDWLQENNLRLLLANPGAPGGQRMTFLLERATDIEAVTGRGTVITPVQRALVNQYHFTNRKRTLVDPTEITPFLRENGGGLADQLVASYAMLYAERMGDTEAYLPLALAYYGTYPTDDYAELNTVAGNFFERSEDPAQLARAIEWAERSVELRTYYPNLATLAWLYHKTGRQERAEATARRAIEQAKADELDYSETEKIFQ